MPGPGAEGPGAAGQCGCFWFSPDAWSVAQVLPGAAAVKGAGSEGVTFRKVGSGPGQAGYSAEWRGLMGRKKLGRPRMGAGTESGPGGRLGGGALSGEELGAFWWRREGRPELGEKRFPELGPLHGPPRVFWLKGGKLENHSG